MATRLQKRRRNRIPLNFARRCQQKIRVQREVVDVNVSQTDSSVPQHEATTYLVETVDADGSNGEAQAGSLLEALDVTEHTKRRLRRAEKWKELRIEANKVIVESLAICNTNECSLPRLQFASTCEMRPMWPSPVLLCCLWN